MHRTLHLVFVLLYSGLEANFENKRAIKRRQNGLSLKNLLKQEK